jgi:hypothetical protein
VEVDPVKIQEGEREIYDWIFDNSFAASLYVHDGIWPVGARLDTDFGPVDFSEIRTTVGLEYAKHR